MSTHIGPRLPFAGAMLGLAALARMSPARVEPPSGARRVGLMIIVLPAWPGLVD